MKKIICCIALLLCLVVIIIILPNKENNKEIILETIKSEKNQIIKVYESSDGYELYYNYIDDVKVIIDENEYYLKEALQKKVISVQELIEDIETVYRNDEYAIIVKNKKVYICSHLISENLIDDNLNWKIEDLNKTSLTFIINNNQKTTYGLDWFLMKSVKV